MSIVDVNELLSDRGLSVIDVRSPGEFGRGHIPGAVSVPLFDNSERAEVGRLYKQSGRAIATQRGMEIASSKVDFLFGEIESVVSKSRFVLHCWRGGMRSRGVAWLCEDCGLDPLLLQGGYRAFRRHAHANFDQPHQIILLAGPTGAGKTQLLGGLKAIGEQVVDLEDLASHRGSVFGSIPDQRQPTVEQFENDLFLQWCDLDPAKPVWVEGESKSIGDVVIPDGLWRQMSRAPMVYVESDRESRIRFLIEQYGNLPSDDLASAVQRLRKRLGGARLQSALEALERSDLSDFCEIVLTYYDKSYEKSLAKRSPETVQRLPISSPGEPTAVGEIIAAGRSLLRSEAYSNIEPAATLD